MRGVLPLTSGMIDETDVGFVNKVGCSQSVILALAKERLVCHVPKLAIDELEEPVFCARVSFSPLPEAGGDGASGVSRIRAFSFLHTSGAGVRSIDFGCGKKTCGQVHLAATVGAWQS